MSPQYSLFHFRAFPASSGSSSDRSKFPTREALCSGCESSGKLRYKLTDFIVPIPLELDVVESEARADRRAFVCAFIVL